MGVVGWGNQARHHQLPRLARQPIRTPSATEAGAWSASLLVEMILGIVFHGWFSFGCKQTDTHCKMLLIIHCNSYTVRLIQTPSGTTDAPRFLCCFVRSVSFAFALATGVPIVAITLFHGYLIAINQTTKEWVRSRSDETVDIGAA